MDEATKTRQLLDDFEKSILSGKGIDIGCGPDPVTPEVRRFDMADGDANVITQFVHEQFDFVYSSHCLEHMHHPPEALLEWWKLVRPGGYLFFIVPDEDLYEQGVFPSRFNSDHKATFTISKAKSWSPVSFNVLDLARGLPNSELIKLALYDHNLDRSLTRHGLGFWDRHPLLWRGWRLVYRMARAVSGKPLTKEERDFYYRYTVDQLEKTGVVGQILCIVKKTA